MKKLFAPIIGLLLASVIGCSSSADSSGKGLIGLAALKSTGQVSFSFDESSAGPSKSIAGPVNAPAVTALVVTITDASNNTVYNAVSLPVTALNGQYITQPLTLAVGSYHLTGFAAVNASGTAIYASPLEGSALAYLVNDPLPINFSVTKNQVSKLVPEVLGTASYTAGDFGYTTFNFDIVETIDFLTSVIAYNETSSNYELTTANITIASGTTTLYTGTLPAAMTAVKVRDGYTSYTVTINKSGFTDYMHTFTNSELKAYMTTPLTLTLTAGTTPMVTSVVNTSYSASDNSIISNSFQQWDADMSNDLRRNSFLTILTSTIIPSGPNSVNNQQWIISTFAGTDGLWFTDDDAVKWHADYKNSNNYVEFYSTGSHASPASYAYSTNTSAGYLDTLLMYGSGPDGILHTGDDQCNGGMKFLYDSQNHVIENWSLMSDGVTPSGIQVVEYGVYGVTKMISYTGNKVSAVYSKTVNYDSNGHAISVNFYSGDLDTQIGRAAIEYDVLGRCTKVIVYNNAGQDGTWGTTDDVIGVVPNPLMQIISIGYAGGEILNELQGMGTLYPVATYTYDQYGFVIKVDCYSDDEVTKQMYVSTVYN